MDLRVPLKDCTVTLCDLRLNKNIHLPENFVELERKLMNEESYSLEFDELEKRNAWCRGAKRTVVSNFESKKNYKEISSESESETEDEKSVIKIQTNSKRPKRKVVNGFKSKKSSSDSESDSEFEKNSSDSESDSEVKKISSDSESDSEDEDKNGFAEHEDKAKVRAKSMKIRAKRELSSYEQMIKKRCQENREFLQSIKIDEAKTSFFEAMSHAKRKKPIRKQQTETEKKASRKSKRLENCHFEFEEKNMSLKAEEAATKESEVLHSPMSFKAAVNPFHKNYLKDIDIQEPKADDELCLYDKYVLGNMELNNSGNTTFSTLTTISWYPSSDHLILAAGNTTGHIAIWNCSESIPVLMRVHKDLHYISHSQFSPYNQANLICSSLDGTVFCADLVQQTFSKICGLNASCTYFDFYSASTYLVALNSGQVAIVDKRTDGKISRMSLHACSDFSVQTLSNHPVNRNFFITAHDKEYKLWDLRMRRYPIAENYQDESLCSAFFSPNTGNCILATYCQPRLRGRFRITKAVATLRMFSFSNTDLEDCIKLEKTSSTCILGLQHARNFSSAATWLSEELFSVRHGGISIYSKDMEGYTHLPTSTRFGPYSFHPKTPALAYSCSSGKISVNLKK